MTDRNMTLLKNKNYSIEFLRFLFCLVIIHYHLFSHHLWFTDFPNIFARGYMGDEFFFLISGFFLAKAAMKSEKKPFDFSVEQLLRRIKKIAIPYYCTWILCFIGQHITMYVMGTGDYDILSNLGNSIYELFFLEMFGFKKGFYSNDVGWFFSALLIVTFILSPLAVRFKEGFTRYFAPLIALFSYGVLSLHFDYLFDPYKLIGGSFLMKGTIRALAAVSLGSFLYSVVSSEAFTSFFGRISQSGRRIVLLLDLLLWGLVFAYVIIPQSFGPGELTLQLDYIITFVMAAALVPVLGNVFSAQKESAGKWALSLGQFAFFAYFGQAVFYSVDKIVYDQPFPVWLMALILDTSVFAVTMLLWFISSKAKHARKCTSR